MPPRKTARSKKVGTAPRVKSNVANQLVATAVQQKESIASDGLVPNNTPTRRSARIQTQSIDKQQSENLSMLNLVKKGRGSNRNTTKRTSDTSLTPVTTKAVTSTKRTTRSGGKKVVVPNKNVASKYRRSKAQLELPKTPLSSTSAVTSSQEKSAKAKPKRVLRAKALKIKKPKITSKKSQKAVKIDEAKENAESKPESKNEINGDDNLQGTLNV